MDVILDPLKDLLSTIAHWLPAFVGALVILLIGYIVSKTVERLVRGGLKKVGFDSLLHKGTAGSYVERVISSPSRLVGTIIFWLLWLGTISIAVTVLGVPALNNFIYAVYAYVPNILGALLIFLVAGAVSAGLVAFVTRVMGDTALAKLVATVGSALTMVIATFMILNQLQIAKDIVNITYTALMGAVALGLALAFGLGGKDVAARLLEQAYSSGLRNAGAAKRDVAMAADRTAHEKDRVVDSVKREGNDR
jgi:hypothetical protein